MSTNDDDIFAQQHTMVVTRTLKPRAYSHTTYVDGEYSSFNPGGGGGEETPAWVPEGAKIHIDLVGGTPQGRAWVDGTGEVDVDTLLGSDPNTENGWGETNYDAGNLGVNGYPFPVPSNIPLAVIGDALALLLADATVTVKTKQVDASELCASNFAVMSATGSDAVEIDTSNNVASPNATARSWGGSLDEDYLDVVNAGIDAVNVVAFTLTGSRLDLAVSGSAAAANVLTTVDYPPGELVAALLDAPGLALQSITIYDPLPSTAGLSELSEP